MNRPVMLALVSLLAAAPAGAQVQAPVANAGDDQTAEEFAEVTLDGSASTDPGGGVLTWQWRQTDGEPKVDLLDASTSTPSFKAPGFLDDDVKLTFTLTVTTSAGGSATDETTVTVRKFNGAPVAALSVDVERGYLVLDASDSRDPDEDALAYRWNMVKATPGVSFDWNAGEWEQSQPKPLIRGRIKFTDPVRRRFVVAIIKLTVTDTAGATDTITSREIIRAGPDLTFRGGSTDGARGGKVAPAGNGGGGGGTALANEMHEGGPFVTLPVWPGRTAVFKLRLSPNIAATFGLEASYGKARLTDSRDEGYAADNPGAFPSGITVAFKDKKGDDIKATTVRAGGDFDYEAHVTVGNRVEPADIDIRFRAYSSTHANAADQLLGRLQVRQPKADVVLRPGRQAGSITPGTAADHVDYLLTVRNESDFAIKKGAITFNPAPPPAIEASLHHDADADGVLSPDEASTAVDNIDDFGGLELEESKQLIVRVRRSGTEFGSFPLLVYVVTELTDENDKMRRDQKHDDNTAALVTSILKSDVTVTLEQAVDAGCDGVADTEFGKNGVDVRPGGCLVYRVTSHSSGNAPATDVRIGTRTPDRTTLEVCTGATSSCGPTLVDEAGFSVADGELAKRPTDGATGEFEAEIKELLPEARRILTFTVRVEQ